tara:strand:+ start:7716 stop:8462 length:747 start_codon:yes stop_codon:yes gene_type:complete
MYLIGDIGNTETKIFLINERLKVINHKTIKTSLISFSYLYKNLNFLEKYKKKIKTILFSSVVPITYKILKKFIKKKIKKKCQELKQVNLKKFVKIKVNKKQIGSDRLANAIGLIDNRYNYIILDFGTATTFDVIIKNQYLGGIISPGVNLSLSTLVSKASLINPVTLSKTSNVIGKNTKNAIRSGFYWGYLGLINNIIEIIIKQTNKKYKIVLTGGLSHLFHDSIKRKNEINKNLTINGILKVAKILK